MAFFLARFEKGMVLRESDHPFSVAFLFLAFTPARTIPVGARAGYMRRWDGPRPIKPVFVPGTPAGTREIPERVYKKYSFSKDYKNAEKRLRSELIGLEEIRSEIVHAEEISEEDFRAYVEEFGGLVGPKVFDVD